MIRYIAVRIIVFLFFCGGSITTAAAQSSSVKLQEEINRLANDSLMKGAMLSLRVVDITSGKELYSHNGRKSLMPASNLKVITTYTALSMLGASYRYETRLEYDGAIDASGTLNGNLYIVGSGDPTLGSFRDISGNLPYDRLLEQWSQKVAAAGIKKINGNITVLSGAFEYNSLPESWIWSDIGNYYGAGAFGLNIHENLYRLYFSSGAKEGDKTTVLRTEPHQPNITFYNEVLCGKPGSGDNAYIYGAPNSYERYISGTIPPAQSEFTIKGSLPDPPLFFGQSFQSYLLKMGISSGQVSTNYDKAELTRTRTRIHTHYSPELSEIVRLTNVHSINLYAEALLKTLALVKSGKGSAKEGLKIIEKFLSQKGIDTTGIQLADGSGLSPFNGISAWHMTEALRLAALDSTIFTSYYASFPIAGINGTVSKLCKGSCAEGNMRIKSGSINSVCCYTGYVKTLSGKWVSFSLMANRYEMTYGTVSKRLEKILILIASL